MIRFLKRLGRDQRGSTSAAGFLLLTTLIALGAIVGLATFRNALVQQFGDLAVSLENLNQSYSTPTSSFVDMGPFPIDNPDLPPGCLDVGVSASDE